MSSIDNILLDPSASIIDGLKTIDTGQRRIGLVVDKAQKLLGTLTDGDVRRAILRGVNLEDPVNSIMNFDFIYIRPGESRESILKLANLNKIYQIPVVDEDFLLLGIEEVSELLVPQERSNKVVLMVGGLGTRLRPLTDDIPKPLLKVGDRPILETIVKSFVKYGFREFIFSVAYKSDMIEQYFGSGERFGAKIQYIHENKRMGTAGSLSLIKNQLTDDFFVMNGDILTNVNFESLLNFHEKHNSDATMCVRQYDYEVPYGVVNVEDYDIVSIKEKPVHKFFVNAGIYMLRPCILKSIPNNTFFDMPTLFNNMIEQNKKTMSFPVMEYWLDIGGIDEYNKANIEYSQHF